MRIDAGRALIAYAGIVTAALAWMLLRDSREPSSRKFDTLEVHRINLREDDGTIRMIISSRDHFPGFILHNQERPNPDRIDSAGMIFFNDEGTENGGLIFGGQKTAGKVTSFGHLSFDQYEQDQVINLEQTEDAGKRYGGLTIADYPDSSLDFDLGERLSKMTPAQREAAIAKLRETGVLGHHRVFLGKSEDRDAVLALQDADGHVRLRLRVTAAGVATIEFLDASGKIIKADGL